jgi:hypothetical protein
MALKLKTPEDFFIYYSETFHFEEGDPEKAVTKEDFIEALNGFAKVKVDEAVNKIAEKVEDELEKDFITKDFILKSLED